jgi:hypothetical protein
MKNQASICMHFLDHLQGHTVLADPQAEKPGG